MIAFVIMCPYCIQWLSPQRGFRRQITFFQSHKSINGYRLMVLMQWYLCKKSIFFCLLMFKKKPKTSSFVVIITEILVEISYLIWGGGCPYKIVLDNEGPSNQKG